MYHRPIFAFGNRVSSYAARALKILILDDALRPQAITAGVPAVVCSTIKQWEDEVLCLRELLGALQTLCWDKSCIKGVLQAEIIPSLIDFVQASDQEVSVLALATLANILTFSDTLLLTDSPNLEALSSGMPVILESLRISQQRPQRFYAAAAVANASSHPRLAGILKQNGALSLVREVERQSLANIHILGSKLGDCAQTAVYRLSDHKEGDVKMGMVKYSFKWGTRPIMELSLAAYGKHSNAIWGCFIVWLLIMLFTFFPLVSAVGVYSL